MRPINLKEYETRTLPISSEELDIIQSHPKLHIDVTPKPGCEGKYDLKPSSTVGAMEIGELSIRIQPKIPIHSLLFLLCYTLDVVKFEERFEFEESNDLLKVVVKSFITAARKAFSLGLLRGYLTEEDALTTVRGRIRIDDQIRRRFGIVVPVEVRYDEFTEDITANRLIKTAAIRLRRILIRSDQNSSQFDQHAQHGLRWINATLGNVSYIEYKKNAVPEVTFNRLNAYYRQVVNLSRLILQHTTFEAKRGDVVATGFLVDMNKAFENFVVTALRKELQLSASQWKQGKTVHLDTDHKVGLEPDLSWWNGENCLFVGDAKYKRTSGDSGARHPDIYQMLAYITALNLSGGLLIYAAGEYEEIIHEVRHVGKRIEVATLDLSGKPKDILTSVAGVATRVKALRNASSSLTNT